MLTINDFYLDDPPLNKALADEFIELILPLIGRYIDNADEFEKDIYEIFPRITDYEYLFDLVKEENHKYDEKRTLEIVEILHNACYRQINIEALRQGMRVTLKDSAYRRKPAMYFANRAADNGSLKGMQSLSDYLLSGEGDIPIDKKRALILRNYASTHGNLKSIMISKLSINDLKKMVLNGNISAQAAIFLTYYRKRRFIPSWIALSKFRNFSNDNQKHDLIDLLNRWYSCDFDITSVIDYINCKKHLFVINYTLGKRLRRMK